MGTLLMRQGRLVEAARTFRMCGDDYWCQLHIVLLLIHRRRDEEAMRLLIGLPTPPSQELCLKALTAKALLLMRLGDLHGAFAVLRKIPIASKTDIASSCLAGLAHFFGGDNTKAAGELRRCADMQRMKEPPPFGVDEGIATDWTANALVCAASAHQAAGSFDTAHGILTTALGIDRDFVPAVLATSFLSVLRHDPNHREAPKSQDIVVQMDRLNQLSELALERGSYALPVTAVKGQLLERQGLFLQAVNVFDSMWQLTTIAGSKKFTDPMADDEVRRSFASALHSVATKKLQHGAHGEGFKMASRANAILSGLSTEFSRILLVQMCEAAVKLQNAKVALSKCEVARKKAPTFDAGRNGEKWAKWKLQQEETQRRRQQQQQQQQQRQRQQQHHQQQWQRQQQYHRQRQQNHRGQPNQDWHGKLGVPRGASKKQIQTAYRKLALQWHPDRHQGSTKEKAQKKFQEIAQAYTALTQGRHKHRGGR
jgi:hypothetical protein